MPSTNVQTGERQSAWRLSRQETSVYRVSLAVCLDRKMLTEAVVVALKRLDVRLPKEPVLVTFERAGVEVSAGLAPGGPWEPRESLAGVIVARLLSEPAAQPA